MICAIIETRFYRHKLLSQASLLERVTRFLRLEQIDFFVRNTIVILQENLKIGGTNAKDKKL